MGSSEAFFEVSGQCGIKKLKCFCFTKIVRSYTPGVVCTFQDQDDLITSAHRSFRSIKQHSETSLFWPLLLFEVGSKCCAVPKCYVKISTL